MKDRVRRLRKNREHIRIQQSKNLRGRFSPRRPGGPAVAHGRGSLPRPLGGPTPTSPARAESKKKQKTHKKEASLPEKSRDGGSRSRRPTVKRRAGVPYPLRSESHPRLLARKSGKRGVASGRRPPPTVQTIYRGVGLLEAQRPETKKKLRPSANLWGTLQRSRG